MKTLLAFVVLSLSLVGCKQGAGERCQRNSDCADGNCSQAEPRVCGGDNSAQLDAQPLPIDAPIDASELPDAPDATVSAAP